MSQTPCCNKKQESRLVQVAFRNKRLGALYTYLQYDDSLLIFFGGGIAFSSPVIRSLAGFRIARFVSAVSVGGFSMISR